MVFAKYTNICMEKRLLYTHCTIVSQCIVSQGSNRHVLLIPREVEAQLNTPHQLSYFSSKINIGRRRHHHHHQPHHHRHHNLTYSHSKNSIPGSGIRPPTFQCVMLGCCNLTVWLQSVRYLKIIIRFVRRCSLLRSLGIIKHTSHFSCGIKPLWIIWESSINRFVRNFPILVVIHNFCWHHNKWIKI